MSTGAGKLLRAPGAMPTVVRGHVAEQEPNTKIHHRFWQSGAGYDRNVIEPPTVFQQIEYIHNNPIRASLREKPPVAG
jgi:hypothetical protein